MTAAEYRKIACPFCAQPIEYDATRAGELCPCPACHQEIVLEPCLQSAPIVMPDFKKRAARPGWDVDKVIVTCGAGVVLAALVWLAWSFPEGVGRVVSLGVGAAVAVAIYFIPTFVAHSRGNRNVPGIFLVNLFFGWTLLGWVAALVWAVYREKP